MQLDLNYFKLINNDGDAWYLKYDQEQNPVICSLTRESKPSRRVYVKGKEIKPVYNGMGISILSTSKGILSDKQARNENVGGEILCTIW